MLRGVIDSTLRHVVRNSRQKQVTQFDKEYKCCFRICWHSELVNRPVSISNCPALVQTFGSIVVDGVIVDGSAYFQSILGRLKSSQTKSKGKNALPAR